jgi:hypothetical protein
MLSTQPLHIIVVNYRQYMYVMIYHNIFLILRDEIINVKDL